MYFGPEDWFDSGNRVYLAGEPYSRALADLTSGVREERLFWEGTPVSLLPLMCCRDVLVLMEG